MRPDALLLPIAAITLECLPALCSSLWQCACRWDYGLWAFNLTLVWDVCAAICVQTMPGVADEIDSIEAVYICNTRSTANTSAAYRCVSGQHFAIDLAILRVATD